MLIDGLSAGAAIIKTPLSSYDRSVGSYSFCYLPVNAMGSIAVAESSR